MNELPSHAKAVLELARDGHEPPDADARARMRQRLAVALTAAAAGGAPVGGAPAAGASSSAGAGKGLWGSWLGVKGWMAAALVVTGAGAAAILTTKPVSAPRTSGPAVSAREEPRAVEVAQPQPAPPVEAESRAAPARIPVTRSSRWPESGAHRSAGGLEKETELLSRAAQRLAHGDVSGARALLEEHRAFERPALREEREGLLVLARCIEAPAAARRRARHFVARTPASVLVARITSACALNEND